MIGVAFAYMVVWNIATPVATTLIASGQSAVLGFTMPLWVALLSWPLLGEKFTPRLFVAMLLGITSVLLIMVPSFASYAQAPLGVSLGLLAGLGWAVGTIIQKRRPVPAPPAVLVGWIMLITTVPIAIAAAFLAAREPGRTVNDHGAHCRHGVRRDRSPRTTGRNTTCSNGMFSSGAVAGAA